VQRQKTSTPLQALVLLNDPQFTEAAKVLAERAIEKYSNETDRIVYAYRSLTGIKPTQKEIAILEGLYTAQYNKFSKDKTKMKGWLATGEYKISKNLKPEELAATTVMVSTIMNSDAFVTKR